ncbi:Polyribonucleotide 5'-hydroxyl-kinase Clp1 [Bienertia sinuspersici]
MLHDIYGRVDGDPVDGEVHASKHKRRSRPRRFLYPKSLVKWILKSIGHKWRDCKCYLKGRGYDDDTDVNNLYDNCPDPDVLYDQWVSLVNFWRSEEGKKRSKHSKESHSKAIVKPIHTTGTKSHARVREELNQIKKIATDFTSVGKRSIWPCSWSGLDVKPSDVGEPSIPRSCTNLNMSTEDEVAFMHYFRQLKGKVERLTNLVRRQGKAIIKVKRKLEDHNITFSDESESDVGTSDSVEFEPEEERENSYPN